MKYIPNIKDKQEKEMRTYKLKRCGSTVSVPPSITLDYLTSLHPFVAHAAGYKHQLLQHLFYFMAYV